MWHCHHGFKLMGCRVVQLMFHKSLLNVYVVGLWIHTCCAQAQACKLGERGVGVGKVRKNEPFHVPTTVDFVQWLF